MCRGAGGVPVSPCRETAHRRTHDEHASQLASDGGTARLPGHSSWLGASGWTLVGATGAGGASAGHSNTAPADFLLRKGAGTVAASKVLTCRPCAMQAHVCKERAES